MRDASRLLLLLLLTSCGNQIVRPSAREPLPPSTVVTIDNTPKARPRLLAHETYLHAYLFWFGGITPLEVEGRARKDGQFKAWADYLASLGLPSYRDDHPRAPQSNALMTSTLEGLAEALCVRAAKRDFHELAAEERIVFPFDAAPAPTREMFAENFGALHRLFLSYPVALAPAARVDRFYAMYRAAASRPRDAGSSLSPEEAAWATVCVALALHPEARLY